MTLDAGAALSIKRTARRAIRASFALPNLVQNRSRTAHEL
jgi:hypothetical protein